LDVLYYIAAIGQIKLKLWLNVTKITHREVIYVWYISFMKLSYESTNHFYFAPTKNGSDLRPLTKLAPGEKYNVR